MGVLSVEQLHLEGPLQWVLPPSKSHLIRWLALAAQSSDTMRIGFSQEPGLDVASMADCLESLGARVERRQGEWIVSGVGDVGFSNPGGTLDCGNSGLSLIHI